MGLDVNEHYEKVSLVGRGSHGLVWHGKRKSDGKRVAVKEIKIDCLESREYNFVLLQYSKGHSEAEQTIKRSGEKAIEHGSVILGEVRILAQLKHPNIILYLDSYITNSSVSIVMELATRGTLHEYLTNRHGQLLEEEEVFCLYSQLVLGLHYLHSSNILHRDLKTQNILLVDMREANLSKDGILLKISDFGLSKMLTSHSEASSVLGTPLYSAPEICSGLPYTKHSDIWASGCVFYEMLTLQKAFAAPTLAAVILRIMRGEVKPVMNQPFSTTVKHLVNALLHQSPNQRPLTSALMAHPSIAPNIFLTRASIGCSQPMPYACDDS